MSCGERWYQRVRASPWRLAGSRVLVTGSPRATGGSEQWRWCHGRHCSRRLGGGRGAGLRTLRLAFHMRRRQGAVIIEPTDAAPTPAAKLDRALIRAVVLARTWAERLERGEVQTIKALARAEGLCNHYTTRLLPLAYLAPDIVA